MPSVSHSEVDGYLLCRRKWYYGYGLSLQRVSTSSSLATGSAGHEIMQAFYQTILDAGDNLEAQQGAWDSAVEAARAKKDEIMADFVQDEKRATLDDVFFKFYLNDEPYVRKGWRVLAVEKKFNLQYDADDELTYPFVVDLIVRDPEGKTVVVDHKFVWDFYTYGDAELQPQIPKYIGALRALNFKIDYGQYNMVRTRLINGTKMNKADLVAVLSTGAEAGDPTITKMTVPQLTELAESQGIKTSTGATMDQMHQTLILDISTSRVVRTFQEQIDVAEEIQAIKLLPLEVQERKAYRVANKMVCQSCSFRDLCTTELSGGNTKLMIATEYTVRERKTWDEITEDAEDAA